MTFSIRNTILIALTTLLIGASATHAFWKSDYPGKPLFVKLENMRSDVIPTITIEHGNDFSQEKIIVTQLQPGELRVISLNHSPGKGYSIKTRLPGGEDIDVCVGKNSDRWVNHILLGETGIWGND
uniref:Uncharacterized protein n=1 Tax=uncultured Thiotrichaceae bacterium TaxID=298394 RepID=A0A6S6TWZ7_9GAMM|nr:MAG: Unknown protein [uncultured Thiotrichaceae bacterium]